MENPRRVMKVIQGWIALTGLHNLPTMRFSNLFELKPICDDPKDGELLLRRMKSNENSMEVRSRSDVQIDDHT